MTTANLTSDQMKKYDSKELYLRLLSYVKPYWKIFIFAIIAMIFQAASEPAFAALLKPLLDGSFVDKDPELITLMPLLLITIFIVRGIATFISKVSLTWISTRAVKDIRRDMHEQILFLPNSYFDNNPTGTIISKLTYNANLVTNACTNALIILIKDSLTIIGLLAYMFYLDWELSLVFFIVLPIAAFLIRIASKRLRILSKSLQEAMGNLTHTLDESITGSKVIKIFGGQEYERNRFDAVNNWVRRFTMKITTTTALLVPIIELIAACVLAFIIYMASLNAAEGNLSVGGFVSFFTAMALLFGPTRRLTRVNEQLQQALAASESIFTLLDETRESQNGTETTGRVKGNLRFELVNYQYENSEHPALKNINLDINAGETIALVGQSGSGKTTLANMMPGLYRPCSGAIYLDNTDISKIKLEELRKNISLVSQDIILFDDTIANNIAYGNMKSQFTKADILNACKAAHAMEFIEKLPDGLQTEIGEGGARLSGGQRQRIAIARAILKDAPILIFDEATSALDSQSEKHVQAALDNLRQGRTSIIIAHRLSTIINADRIVVLQQGEIKESGTHSELIDKQGIYALLHQQAEL